MPIQRINTIEELQLEQDRIVDKMRSTRNEFSRSFSKTTYVGRDFLLKNILLPAGAIGLGLFVAKKFAGETSIDHKASANIDYEANIGDDNSRGWFSKLMMVALPVVQQLFLKAKTDEDAEAGAVKVYGESNETHGSWLSTIVPLTIPILQQYFLTKSEQAEGRSMTIDMEDGETLEGTFSAKKDGSSSIFDSLYKMLPVVLPLVQQYFAQTAPKPTTEKSAKPFYDNSGQLAVATT